MTEAAKTLGSAIPLADGKLHVVPMPFSLDGRASTHPPEIRGYAAFNSYVVRQGGEALVIDTGMTAGREQLLGELHRLIDGDARVSIWALRDGELPSICNIRQIVEEFPTTTVYAAQLGDPWNWNIKPKSPDETFDQLTSVTVRRGDMVPVDTAGQRRIAVIEPPLRLLQTHWGYDRQSRTLFTSDAFGHTFASSRSGPWVIRDGDDDPTTVDSIRRHLTRTRYWWLSGADTRPIREAINQVFETHDIEIIAPHYGLVLEGRQVVERHRRMLDEALQAEHAQPPKYIPGLVDFVP